jgi:peptidoglycan-associated lipoprotein
VGKTGRHVSKLKAEDEFASFRIKDSSGCTTEHGRYAAQRPAMISTNTSFTFIRHLGISVSCLVLVAFAGCTNKKGQTAGETGDYVTGTPLPERQEGTSFLSGNVDRNQFQPIYFDFDSQTIRSAENGKIQQIASFLHQGNAQIIIAGFTDERGTPEYNRGLGERRAESVREALIALGSNAQNVQTVSFGLEMPADAGHDEAAWAKNRRAEIGVVK